MKPFLSCIPCAVGVALLGCSAEPATKPAPPDLPVHTLIVPEEAAPALPEGEGRDQVYASCLICHSSRYIAIQPIFSRKTWQAVVEKMQKTYGAPVPEESLPLIVNYLVATHGKE